ncbi:hypothetical protein KP78_13640 [Jeotgalibacillus soli]|uniref:Uncharacterized protein n=1 Tax=Jeotgalibacillus soli TaxID=889306 RepID=A0A0C2VZV3_9BACL|nr:hypothetical protein KP78_13640 [Jeotgalibacillus soli]
MLFHHLDFTHYACQQREKHYCQQSFLYRRSMNRVVWTAFED